MKWLKASYYITSAAAIISATATALLLTFSYLTYLDYEKVKHNPLLLQKFISVLQARIEILIYLALASTIFYIIFMLAITDTLERIIKRLDVS